VAVCKKETVQSSEQGCDGGYHASTTVNGRPDWAGVFREATAAARAAGEARVAVLVCGGRGMVDHVLMQCKRQSTTEISFRCHYEVFGFD
jgi:Ferric reductase NAD binding domain